MARSSVDRDIRVADDAAPLVALALRVLGESFRRSAHGLGSLIGKLLAHIGRGDVCVTGDIPLASRCLAGGARALAPNGHLWTPDNIGGALAGREIARHLRELGATTSGPPPLTRQDRSRFLSALDTAVQAALRARPAAG